MRSPPAGRRSVATDVALGALLGMGGFVDGIASSGFPRPGLAVGITMAVAGAAQAFRRLLPIVAFTVSMAAMGALAVVFGHFESGSSILIALVATYSVVVFGSNLPFAAAVLVAFSAALNLNQPVAEATGDLAFTLVFCGLAFGGGLGVRVVRGRATASAERTAAVERERDAAVRNVVEQERNQLARELHDILAHGLGVIMLQAGAAEHALESDPERARAAIEAARTTAQDAIGELQALVRAVRADAPDSREPQPTLEDLPRLAERASVAGFLVRLTIDGVPRPVPAAVQASVYRVAQEGLSNAMKHSGTAGCSIGLRYLEDQVRIEVLDDGRPGIPGQGSRFGLVGIRERVDVLGGCMRAGPRAVGGWAMVAEFPSVR